jgi:farnesyl-diphosphate farnesyltransferase
MLPEGLRIAVGNAYLLCRIVDTVEDEPTLVGSQKARLSGEFLRVLRGELDPRAFADELAPLLSDATLPADRELIRQTPYVLSITQSLDPRQQAAIERCVAIMADGMVAFQTRDVPRGLSDGDAHGLSDGVSRRLPSGMSRGLPDQEAMDRYCYHVAGVVGELLTELFCIQLPALESQRDPMMALGRSFGQGLQMTNILKDLWDDLERGACWLPKSVFDGVGFDLSELRRGQNDADFQRGLSELIGIAHGHLVNALDYTLRIPASEAGIRTFCLWTLGMAILTLRKIHRNRGYTAGSQVKISRRSVRAMARLSGASARHAPVVRALFSLVGWGIPRTMVEVEAAV